MTSFKSDNRALFVSQSELVDPSVVPFSPTWTVGFDCHFWSNELQKWLPDSASFELGEIVQKWIDANASKRMVMFSSGEVICEDETDATLLFMRFH